MDLQVLGIFLIRCLVTYFFYEAGFHWVANQDVEARNYGWVEYMLGDVLWQTFFLHLVEYLYTVKNE